MYNIMYINYKQYNMYKFIICINMVHGKGKCDK